MEVAVDGVSAVQQVQPTVAYVLKAEKVVYHSVWILNLLIAALEQVISVVLA
jgi:hypothetical protein